jgi:UDP-N-acetylglucosamine acyltransferase
MIHSTAIVDRRAEIDTGVTIGPYSVVGPNVKIGRDTVVGPHVTIEPFVTIGARCHIFQYASIGAIPQTVTWGDEESYVAIGAGTVIREFVTINRGTESGGGTTRVGEGNFLMAYCHIAHDCQLGRRVILANNTTLAGHITIGDFATVGGLTAVHQFARIGEYAFVGGTSGVAKDIPPYVLAWGNRAKLYGLNTVGLKRHGFSPDTLANLKKVYRIVFRIGLTLNEAIERIKAEGDMIPEVTNFIAFVESSKRGLTR